VYPYLSTGIRVTAYPKNVPENNQRIFQRILIPDKKPRECYFQIK
jgi:hypothetical protein